MTLMTDADVRSAIERGDIDFDPRPDDVKAASVDIRLGPEAFLGTGTDGLISRSSGC